MCRKLLQLLILPLLLFISQLIFAQDRVITGKVTDQNGNAVPGVSITPKGGGQGTLTNTDGTFRITVRSSVTTLIFSSVGYATQEVSATGNSIDVSVAVSTTSLNEVVVIGYGTRLKKDLTGAVTNITSKDFNKGAITTPEQLIAGKVAGVQVTSNSGAPGSGSTIRIRGGASINASNDPLIVIDGVPLGFGNISGSPNPLATINPNDIESINILKDASATAIYGSRASNGVIIVTTKKGKSGKPKFNFTTQYSLSTPTKNYDVLSPTQFRAYVKSHGTPAQIALMGGASTNWFDEIFHKAGSTDNNLSVGGSIKSLPYRISLGYLNQDGILRTGNLKRKSAALNLNPTLFHNSLKIDISVKGSISNSRFPDEGAIGSAAYFDPTQFVHSAGKRFGGYYEWLDPNSVSGLKALAPRNPVGLLNQRINESEVKRSIGNIQLDQKLSQYLHAKLNLGYDVSKGEGTVFVPDSAASSYKRFLASDGLHGGENNQYLQKRSDKLLELYLNYVREFESIESKVDVIAGYSYQDFKTTSYNFPDKTTDGTIVSSPTFPFDKPELTLIGAFGRLSYTLKNKYLFTATIRSDGTSRISEKNRWGWFPSAAFAWRIIDEDFMKGSKVFNDLKLRLGYGRTGQQEGIGLYSYIANYSTGNAMAQYQFGNSFYFVYRPDGYNPNLKWEETSTYNAGLDYGFLDNRITGTLDVYYKKTKDLLNTVTQPAGTNFSNTITANVGKMENKGVELNINAQPVRNKNLTWDFNFNITYNHNEVTNLTLFPDSTFPGNQYGGISGGTGNTTLINSVGYNRGAFYVYQQVYNASGKPVENLFVDRNGDGQITDKDLYRYKGVDPKIFLGAGSNVNWKNWNGGFSLRANIGNYMYNNRSAGTGTQSSILNPLGLLGNGSASVLETNFAGGGTRQFLSDYYIENASFLRMDNIYVGFNAGSFVRKNTTLRLTANVQNVFIITKYKGLDPEINGGIDNSFYKRPRVFAVTASLDF